MRSSVTGPHLPMLRSRIDLFEMTAAGIVEYLRGAWPDELADVRFEVAALPPALRQNAVGEEAGEEAGEE